MFGKWSILDVASGFGPFQIGSYMVNQGLKVVHLIFGCRVVCGWGPFGSGDYMVVEGQKRVHFGCPVRFWTILNWQLHTESRFKIGPFWMSGRILDHF